MRSSPLIASFEQLSGGKSLKRVAGIRWANEVEVWESVLQHRLHVTAMLYSHQDHYSRRHGVSLETGDFKNLSRLCDILGPLREFTRRMEGNKPTGSKVIVMWLELLLHLDGMEEKFAEFSDLCDALQAARLKAKQYLNRATECDPLLLATALNPLYRLVFFEKYQEQLGIAPASVRALLASFCARIIEGEAAQPSASQPRKRKRLGSPSYFHCFGEDTDAPAPSEDTIAAEINRYNRNVGVSAQSNVADPLEWWKENSYVFPILSKAARQCLSVLGSQAVTERLFSASAAVCNPRRMGNFKAEAISTQVGVDQLLLNGYRAAGSWGRAQGIIDEFEPVRLRPRGRNSDVQPPDKS